MKMQTIGIVRDRGQITIPNKIRGITKWIYPSAVVSIAVTSNKELIVKPYEKEQKKEVNWVEIWKEIHKIRSFRGKKGSASRFIIKDRERH